MSGESDGGKGSRPRPYTISLDEYADNYDRIFGNAPKKRKEPKSNLSEYKDGASQRKTPSSSRGNRNVKGKARWETESWE